MAAVPGLPESLRQYHGYSIHALSGSTRLLLSQHLNPTKDILSPNTNLLQDYRGLAEVLDFSSLEIDNIARDGNPTTQLFSQWIIRPDATIGHLLDALCEIERFDILGNSRLENGIKRDVEKYSQHEAKMSRPKVLEPIQVPDVGCSEDMEVDEFRNITTNEEDGQPEYFDAFVSYTSADFWFVKQMIHILEVVHGLKLCLPQRNLRPGCAKYVIMAKLIQDRCKKMIIILSPNLKNSPECEFQSRFGFALSPGAKEKKLIPVIIEPCNVPSLFNHIALLDYTKCDVIDWFWERLAKSLKKEPAESVILGPRRNIADAGQSSTAGSKRAAPFRNVPNPINTSESRSSNSSIPSSISEVTRAKVHLYPANQDNYSSTNSTRTSSPRPETSLIYISSESSMSSTHLGMNSVSVSWLMGSSEMEQGSEQHQPMEMQSLQNSHLASSAPSIVTQEPLIRSTTRQDPLPQSIRSKFTWLENKFSSKKN